MKGKAFFASDGRLLLTQNGPDIHPPDRTAFEAAVDNINDTHIYYDEVSGTVETKKLFPVTVVGKSLRGIPKGTKVNINYAEHIENNAEIDFSNHPPGSIIVILDHPHYEIAVVEVVV